MGQAEGVFEMSVALIEKTFPTPPKESVAQGDAFLRYLAHHTTDRQTIKIVSKITANKENYLELEARAIISEAELQVLARKFINNQKRKANVANHRKRHNAERRTNKSSG